MTGPCPGRYPIGMARSDFSDMKGALGRALRQVAEAGPASVLGPVWEEVVGAALARHSRPVRLQDGALTVAVSPEFAAELEREQATLCGRLNARLGKDSVRRLWLVPEGS